VAEAAEPPTAEAVMYFETHIRPLLAGRCYPPGHSEREQAEAPLSDSAADPQAGRNHWAFQPLTRPAIPAVRPTDWPRTTLDTFVLARLESSDLRPAPDADRRTLVRRVYLRLLGLPPTPDQIAAFLADTRPDAYERLVDQLLNSPHFGERWGRHLLDLADRFAMVAQSAGAVRRVESHIYHEQSPR
jgi:hypothetical protein